MQEFAVVAEDTATGKLKIITHSLPTMEAAERERQRLTDELQPVAPWEATVHYHVATEAALVRIGIW